MSRIKVALEAQRFLLPSPTPLATVLLILMRFSRYFFYLRFVLFAKIVYTTTKLRQRYCTVLLRENINF